MLCAAVDIGSNTTRVLVAEPQEGQLRKVMEQRAYTRIDKDSKRKGKITDEKIAELAEVVDHPGAARRGARRRGDPDRRHRRDPRGEERASEVGAARSPARPGVAVEILSEEEEGRLAFIGATKTLGHPVEGEIGVVDVGGGSSEIILGTVADGRPRGALVQDRLRRARRGLPRPTTRLRPAEIRALRDHIDDFFADVEVDQPTQAVAVGGSATSLRTLVGAVLEYETLERAVRVLAGDPIAEVAKRFELDPRRVRILPAGVLLLEKLSELLGQPLQIGKGGLREGVILDLLTTAPPTAPPTALAA